MKKNIILGRFFFLAALSLAAFCCQADGASKIPKQRENRFLFVVDTSSAMRGYSNAVVEGVVELLNSDMRGEFREGDTIGLWTYNDKLHPEFPMQVWSKTGKNNIVADMAAFLRERRYARQGRLEKVMPALNQIIKSSERITVILIYDGTGSIQGTPFDKNINGLQKKYARELKLAHEPFITVLAARDGAVFDYTINYPGLVAIPHTANPEPVVTNAPVVAIANAPSPAVQPRRTRPFIMSAAANESQAAVSAPALTLAVSAPVAPVIVQAPVSQPPPAAVAPPPVAVVVAAPPPTQPVSAPVVARQNPAPANETPAPQSPPASVTADTQQPAPAQAVAQTAAMAAIEPAANSQLALFVIAFSLLTIAVVLVVFLVRRSRHVAQSSLITQSIDRPR